VDGLEELELTRFAAGRSTTALVRAAGPYSSSKCLAKCEIGHVVAHPPIRLQFLSLSQRTDQIVVFDLDGTLADTQDSILACARAVYAEHGLRVPRSDRLTQAIGISLPNLLARGCTTPLSPHLLDSLTARYRELYPAAFKRHARLFPGAAELIASLNRFGVRLAVATSKSRVGATALLLRYWPHRTFQCVVTDDDVAAKKPAPDMVELVLERLGGTAENTLMVGDTGFDMEMGRAAGVQTCGVTWGNHPRSVLEDAGADHIAAQTEEILTLVEALFIARRRACPPRHRGWRE
jgi:phosphoglycolate phosphatase